MEGGEQLAVEGGRAGASREKERTPAYGGRAWRGFFPTARSTMDDAEGASLRGGIRRGRQIVWSRRAYGLAHSCQDAWTTVET